MKRGVLGTWNQIIMDFLSVNVNNKNEFSSFFGVKIIDILKTNKSISLVLINY
jgi:hypothetical protein